MTAPAPTVCRTCHGEGVVGHTTKSWCPGCRCTTCGQPCQYPPECRSCAAQDEATAKRRADQ